MKLVAAGMVLVAIFYLFVMQLDVSQQNKCRDFTAIAGDSHKIGYVREWMARRMADKEFTAAVEKYRWFERGSPFTQRYIDIDWRYLGFDPQSAWIGFNVNEAQGQDADDTRILSLSLNQGRAGVIIKLKPTDDVVGMGPPGNPNTVKPVGDDVFVYCDFGD